MKRNILIIMLLFVIANIYSQSINPIDELKKVVERDKEMLPHDIEGVGAATDTYLEDSYYTIVCEIDNMSIFENLRDYKKVVKKATIEHLSHDSDFIDTAKLLIACNKEVKYLYIYKYKGWKTEIIITKKDLKRMLKQ